MSFHGILAERGIETPGNGVPEPGIALIVIKPEQLRFRSPLAEIIVHRLVELFAENVDHSPLATEVKMQLIVRLGDDKCVLFHGEIPPKINFYRYYKRQSDKNHIFGS